MDSACAGVNKQVTRFNIIGIFTSMFKNPFGKLINQLISIYDQFSPRAAVILTDLTLVVQ